MAPRNTKNAARGSATLAALAVLLVAAPVLADGSEIRAKAQGCGQVERVAGAACPMREAAQPSEDAAGHGTDVAMGDVEIPIYVPPNRGSSQSRTSGAVRGLRQPGPRL